MTLTLTLGDSEHHHGLSVRVGAYESQAQLTEDPLGPLCYSSFAWSPYFS